MWLKKNLNNNTKKNHNNNTITVKQITLNQNYHKSKQCGS